MEDTTQTTAPDVDPIDQLEADVQAMTGAASAAEPAAEPVAEAEPTANPESWEQRYSELEGTVAKERQEVRQWFGGHFNSREKYEAFAAWSQNYDSGQPAAPVTPQAPAEPEAMADEDDDVFATIDNNKARMLQMEKQLAEMQRARELQTQQQVIAQTEAEADELALKYPAVANPAGRRMMMQIALATIDQGGTMEQAAKQLQAMTGTAAPQNGTPTQGVRQVPTSINGGGAGRSVAVQDGDSREADWFNKENLDSMDVFDVIMRDSRKEFGIPH